MKFCLDACSIITPISISHKIERFPTLWKQLDAKLQDGSVFSINEVFHELKSASALAWATERKAYFLDHDHLVLSKMPQVMKDFPLLIQNNENDQADPYLISYALANPGVTIVTEENRKAKKDRITIPVVCEKYGIPCIKFVDLIDQLNLTI